MPKSRKRKDKKKVALPKDSKGRAIQIDDTVAWEDGTVFKVAYMTYYGKCLGEEWWDIQGEDEDDWSDNPGACKVIWRPSDHE